MKTFKLSFAVMVCVLLMTGTSGANVKQLKTYKKTYPDIKPKCIFCHVDQKPKKDDGKHDVNAYGAKLKEMMGDGEMTEEVIKSVGRHDNFDGEKKEKTEDAVEQIKDAVDQIEDAIEEIESKKGSNKGSNK